MDGWVKVLFPKARDVYVDGIRCGVTNTPFNVQLGTHTFDLDVPNDYTPPTETLSIDGTPTNPTVVKFDPR